MNIFLGYLFTYIYIFFIIFFAKYIKEKFYLSEEFSRKMVHIFVSFAWIIMIHYFSNTWHLVVPPITFIILNYISYKKNIFSAIERKNNDSFGTVYYPISMTILSTITILDLNFIAPYGIGLFCMAIGDGFAPYFGSKYKSFKFINNKTIFGIFIVFISALFISIIFSNIYNLPFNIYDAFIIAIFSSIFEFIGLKGLDNLFLPIGSAIVAYILLFI